MNNVVIDLRNFAPVSPEDIVNFKLKVGVRLREPGYTKIYSYEFRSSTAWDVYPFENLDHAIEIFRVWRPHIFVTHWHERTHFDNKVTELVLDFKKSRGLPGIGDGPMLVGTYLPDTNVNDMKSFLNFLHDTYDHVIYLEYDTFKDRCIPELCQKMWSLLPKIIEINK